MHATGRAANLLGALALAVGDRLQSTAQSRGAVSPSAAAVLVVLREVGPMGVTRLGHSVGLTQSAATRVADSLEQAGLVERTAVGRERVITLTPAGTGAAQSVLDERAAWLEHVVSALDATDIAALERISSTLLRQVYDTVPNSALLCRFCDRAVCISTAECPVGRAERDRDAP